MKRDAYVEAIIVAACAFVKADRAVDEYTIATEIAKDREYDPAHERALLTERDSTIDALKDAGMPMRAPRRARRKARNSKTPPP